MDTVTVVYSVAVVAVAYLVRGIAGFGSALIAVPLLALMFPITVVVPLVVFLDFLGSLGQGVKNRQEIAWRELLPIFPFSFLGVIVALYLFRTVDSSALAKGLGLFVLAFAVYQLLPLPEMRGSRWFAAPAGIFGGLLGTLFGTGGPFYVIYLTLRGLHKSAFRPSFATNFLIEGVVRLSGYVIAGFMSAAWIESFLIAFPAAAIALYVGGRIHMRMTQQSFKRIISVLLVCSGSALLFR